MEKKKFFLFYMKINNIEYINLLVLLYFYKIFN